VRPVGNIAALHAFKNKRLGHHRHGERSQIAGDFGDNRRGSTAGAAAEAAGDKNHIRAFSDSRISLMLSSAAFCPTSGSMPAPSPREMDLPI